MLACGFRGLHIWSTGSHTSRTAAWEHHSKWAEERIPFLTEAHEQRNPEQEGQQFHMLVEGTPVLTYAIQ